MSAEQIGSSYMFTTKSSRWETPEGKFDENNLIRIPYNLIDKDRLILACRTKKFEWNIFVSPDPKVDVNYKETFEKDINDYLKRTCNKLDGTDTTYIYDEAVQGLLYYSTFITNAKHSNANIKGIPLYLKAMKDMLDEYNYVIKKNKATGSDVTITDNIKYNHEKGRISYNDFSIEIDDEMLKADLYETFNAHLIKYYRNESTEQEILDNITYTVFISLQRRINNNRSNFSITIKINDVVEINLKARKSEKNGAIFYYLNNKRFNKNEIITLLREMTCYRNATEATAFISNISRLGLAVYIGITTGYEVKISKDKNQVFKFRKLKGRANYQLILDGTDVPIKGKKLITLLYNDFIGEYVNNFKNKIPEYIYECTGSAVEYLKYKALIDSSYEAFKEKSHEFLRKKIKDMDAKETKYYNKKARKVFDAIYVEGTSKNKYIIAYDTKNSYVFMAPEYDEAEKRYGEGKYICMIDQSNIKSNISYDTVIAKLMALKNDSSIAHTIYNLEEEL